MMAWIKFPLMHLLEHIQSDTVCLLEHILSNKLYHLNSCNTLHVFYFSPILYCATSFISSCRPYQRILYIVEVISLKAECPKPVVVLGTFFWGSLLHLSPSKQSTTTNLALSFPKIFCQQSLLHCRKFHFPGHVKGIQIFLFFFKNS